MSERERAELIERCKGLSAYILRGTELGRRAIMGENLDTIIAALDYVAALRSPDTSQQEQQPRADAPPDLVGRLQRDAKLHAAWDHFCTVKGRSEKGAAPLDTIKINRTAALEQEAAAEIARLRADRDKWRDSAEELSQQMNGWILAHRDARAELDQAREALKLVPLFYEPYWTDEKIAEWKRITGTHCGNYQSHVQSHSHRSHTGTAAGTAREGGGVMPFFRKKPVEIEAWLFDGTKQSALEIVRMSETMHILSNEDGEAWVIIETLEGRMTANPGDWVIKGVKGEFYPCKPDIFAATYEPAPKSEGGGE